LALGLAVGAGRMPILRSLTDEKQTHRHGEVTSVTCDVRIVPLWITAAAFPGHGTPPTSFHSQTLSSAPPREKVKEHPQLAEPKQHGWGEEIGIVSDEEVAKEEESHEAIDRRR